MVDLDLSYLQRLDFGNIKYENKIYTCAPEAEIVNYNIDTLKFNLLFGGYDYKL